jgi:hypothetical protein
VTNRYGVAGSGCATTTSKEYVMTVSASVRVGLRGTPGWLAVAVLLVGAGALLVKATGLALLALVVLADRIVFAAIAGADWVDERVAARAGMDPVSRLGFTPAGGGTR